MRRLFATALIAMTAACVPLAFGGNQEEANRIAKSISAVYPQYTVEVAYKNGRVRLRGEVANTTERQHITQMVSQFPGVHSVSADSIQVVPDVDGGPQGGFSSVASSQVMPAVPTAETQTVPEVYRIAQASTFTPDQTIPAMSVPSQNADGFATTYSGPSDGMVNPVSGEFAMGGFPESAQLQTLPVAVDNYQTGLPQGTRIGSYSAAPVAAGRYGQGGEPNLPNYAWPTTADYPNYAQVGYPKQYAAGAFPYIGPFYPYPQVPLGWRKVTMEWHDGYWWLDFNDGSVNGPFSPLFRQPTKYR
jgi:hypothetical protein